jgi:hypothetical protein
MKIPEKIGAIPKAFVKLRDAINFLLDFAQIVRDAQGKNGIKILVTDQNMVIENDPDGGDEDGKGGTPGPSGLPNGVAGDVLYHDGGGWVRLPAPSAGPVDAVLRHDGTAPYWDTPEECP